MVRKIFVFFLFVVIFLLTSSCSSSASTKADVSQGVVDGDALEYEIVQQGEVKVSGLYLVGQGGTYDYALVYEASSEGVGMLFTIADDKVKMVRRIMLPPGKGIVKFNANSDWVENSDGLKLELSLKGSSKKTVINFEGR